MALNWSLVYVFLLGLITTLSTVRNIFRLSTDYEDLDFTQIVAKHGYIGENYTVQTEDGYLLNLYRITYSEKCKGEKTKSPVLLLNGLLASADCFLDAGVDNGLPYLLADSCYDIWVGNARGSYNGRRHITLNPDTDRAFWDFSVDEIGKYDVPATIDFVLNYTGEKQLNYMGVSQGSGSFFVMCSERPEYSDKVKVLIGLAPASKHTHAKSELFRTASTFIRDYEHILQAIGMWEYLWKGIVDPVKVLCQYKPAVCSYFISIIDASHTGSYTDESLKLALQHFPAGTSTKNLARYGQSVNVDRYCKFDYGPEKNMKLYGGEPPEFNLSTVRTPTYFLFGRNDGIVDIKDMDWLVSQLPNVKEYVIMEDPLWNHLDMVVGKDIGSMLFPKILKFLKLHNDSQEGIADTIKYNDTLSEVTLSPEVRAVG